MRRAPRGTTIGDLIALLRADGWVEEGADVRASVLPLGERPPWRGFAHPRKPGVLWLCGELDEVIAPETVRNLLNRAQMR